jgi:hypothetical protein
MKAARSTKDNMTTEMPKGARAPVGGTRGEVNGRLGCSGLAASS